MVILDATIYDLDGITACAERFFEYAGYAEKFNMPLDRGSFQAMVSPYIQQDNGICLLVKNSDPGNVLGGICGTVVPWGFNSEIKIALELFYWLDPDARGFGLKLIKAYEDRVKEMGARNVMIQPETELTEKVGTLYRRRGYRPFERFWIK